MSHSKHKIKIKRTDGTKVELDKVGKVWFHNATGGRQIGQIYAHGICNIWPSIGPTDKLVPVSRMLLKYSSKLGIRKIRREFSNIVATNVGNRTVVRYGYLDKKDFSYYLSHREKSEMHSGLYLLLKTKDWEMHSQ